MSMPSTKPRIPNFSSGPCAKRPGYDVAQLDLSALGRSHRSALGKKLLGACCTETARILGLPEGYRVAVVPASDTGAVEMAMWSLLGPRAVERLESYSPPWPLPKIFRMTSGGKLTEGLFKGDTINTPSMLCVADYLDALKWCESVGGVQGTIARSQANLKVIEDFVADNPWISFLAKTKETRSNTSVCLSLDLPEDKVKALVKLLETEGVAYDIGSYKDAPPGIRIWCGATVEKSDLEALMPWLKWAYEQVKG